MNLDNWRTVTLSTAALGQTLFVLLYLTFPWYRSFLGRALFFKASVLCILLDFIVIARLWEWSNADRVFVILYGILAVGIWAQLSAFIRTKRCGLRKALNGTTQDDRGSDL